MAIVFAVDPGRFTFTYVDVGGHSLRMLICGHGSPTVVFETGGGGAEGGTLESWERVQSGVSRFARTVTYDRAGIGFSPAGPRPRDARRIASELHTALQNAHVAPPYVLVGHSFGGPLNRVFYDMYPADVAGIVLVDPGQEAYLEWHEAHYGPHETREDDESKDFIASLNEAHQSRVPSGIPVVLISAMKQPPEYESADAKQKEEMKTNKQAWMRFQKEWVAKIPNGKQIITEKSDHMVPIEEPELVVNSVRQVVEQVRAQRP